MPTIAIGWTGVSVSGFSGIGGASHLSLTVMGVVLPHMPHSRIAQNIRHSPENGAQHNDAMTGGSAPARRKRAAAGCAWPGAKRRHTCQHFITLPRLPPESCRTPVAGMKLLVAARAVKA
jgi:hypothetical protein